MRGQRYLYVWFWLFPTSTKRSSYYACQVVERSVPGTTTNVNRVIALDFWVQDRGTTNKYDQRVVQHGHTH